MSEDSKGAEREAVPLRSGSASLPPPSASLPSSSGGAGSGSATTPLHDYLRRLDPAAYRGCAQVHWVMTVTGRQTGWLDPHTHAIWREAWLHTLARYRLAVPIYCLMPDHVHALVVGLAPSSDQRLALSFLRRHTAGMFFAVGAGWQKQGYDHVLREQERARDGGAAVARYIVENPVRAGLVQRAPEWSYSGSVIAGWPDLDWRRDDFWERWWKIFAASEAE